MTGAAQEGVLLELRVEARPDRMQRVREAVRRSAESCGCSADCASDVVLAVDEACQNVIRHAYGDASGGSIEIVVERKGGDLVVSILDFAPATDPDRVKPRDLDDLRPGGLGTHLIREVMDSADFVPPPPGAGNLLRMVKRIE